MTARSPTAAATAYRRSVAERRARFMAVTHLPHGAAAKVLGCTRQNVRSYRHDNPAVRYVPPEAKAGATKPVRNVRQVMFGGEGQRINVVSLPKETWDRALVSVRKQMEAKP